MEKSCRTQGRISVSPSIRPSVRPYVPPRASEGPWRAQEALGVPQRGLRGSQMDRWTDGRTEILPCVLQDFVPFGSAALLQLTKNNRNTKQGKGIADHYWPRPVFY